MAVKFFFGADGAAIAFQKEQDYPDWSQAVYNAGAETNWTTNPSTIPEANRTLDVRNVRRAVITLEVSGANTYDFTVKNGTTSTNNADWFDLDGGVYTGESGKLYVGVDCLGLEYIAVVIDNVSGADTLAVEMAPLPYETTE